MSWPPCDDLDSRLIATAAKKGKLHIAMPGCTNIIMCHRQLSNISCFEGVESATKSKRSWSPRFFAQLHLTAQRPIDEASRPRSSQLTYTCGAILKYGVRGAPREGGQGLLSLHLVFAAPCGGALGMRHCAQPGLGAPASCHLVGVTRQGPCTSSSLGDLPCGSNACISFRPVCPGRWVRLGIAPADSVLSSRRGTYTKVYTPIGCRYEAAGIPLLSRRGSKHACRTAGWGG